MLDRSLPVEQIITRPPIAVFEILSPEDTLNRMLTKLADYERMGIHGRSWSSIRPENIFVLNQACLKKLTDIAFDLPGSACRFDLAEIQKLLD